MRERFAPAAQAGDPAAKTEARCASLAAEPGFGGDQSQGFAGRLGWGCRLRLARGPITLRAQHSASLPLPRTRTSTGTGLTAALLLLVARCSFGPACVQHGSASRTSTSPLAHGDSAKASPSASDTQPGNRSCCSQPPKAARSAFSPVTWFARPSPRPRPATHHSLSRWRGRESCRLARPPAQSSLPSVAIPSTRGRTKTPTPPPPPPPEPVVEEASPTPPPPPLPTSVEPGKPLPTIEVAQSHDLSPEDYQSISESGVLAESLARSRQRWISEGLFEKYWTKPHKKKGVLIEDPKNPPKDSMTKIGNVTITIEPHIVEATMYAVKGPKQKPAPQEKMPQKPPQQQPARPIIQYGPANGDQFFFTTPPNPSAWYAPN
ncbi:hypothetical protein NLG97_g8859 [Lecanicillium saksenae]|uniref:Uncharacterized protein n=1 Tax=Lecanicillium saksenae TaxID=468837 RepID=A0ACC1QHN8_9HYPO|nr:hypothetical protein NLG97_g8859 [Lecanicillium saksenae]